MPSFEYMRNAVLGLYPGKAWARRVRQMPDSQIMAIYMKRIAAGEAKPEPKTEPPRENDIPF